MFGSIKKIENKEITIENLSNRPLTSLMNYHLVLESENRLIVGEVIYIDEKIAKLMLIGEICDNSFQTGIVKSPSGTPTVRVIKAEELELIYGSPKDKRNIHLGTSAIYKNFLISIPLNSFFSYHSAIIGNTGSGKSCGVARIIQNLFLQPNIRPKNAHIVLFDAYGEYANAFDKLNEEGYNFAKYSNTLGDNPLKFPAYFLDVDDLAILLQVTSSEQIPVLNKTLKLVNIFKSQDPKMKEYKNDIIAACLLDILTSGRPSSSIRDQIIAVLSHYNTDELNLESQIKQPGYDRTLRQCLLIDESGKMNAIYEVVKFLSNFEKINLEDLHLIEDYPYDLNDLYYALEFALISEGSINSDIAYKQTNILKTRLQTLINSKESTIFATDTYQSKESFINNMFGKNNLVNINLNEYTDSFAKILTKLYSKLLFNYTTKQEKRGNFTVNIILEEAHRYVQNDTDINIIGYNIFDRITKEGRKYGTLLTFITQRPSELSKTALSQCANFIVFRVFYPDDLSIIKSMSTNVSNVTLEQIKSLSPGSAFAFGTGFKIPTLIEFKLPNPMPTSTSIDVENLWFEEEI